MANKDKNKPKRKRGGQFKFTKAQLIESLEKNHGLITATARDLGVIPQTVRMHIEKDPEIREAWEQAREDLIDLAEDALIKKVKKGDLGAIIFVLKCHGRQRGWIERNTNDINVNFPPDLIEALSRVREMAKI